MSIFGLLERFVVAVESIATSQKDMAQAQVFSAEANAMLARTRKDEYIDDRENRLVVHEINRLQLLREKDNVSLRAALDKWNSLALDVDLLQGMLAWYVVKSAEETRAAEGGGK